MARVAFLIVFIAFTTFSAWVTLETSYLGAFPPWATELNTWQIFTDLVVACTIVLFFLARDRRGSGRPLWPVVVVAIGVALLGSIALLLYLILDPMASRLPARAR